MIHIQSDIILEKKNKKSMCACFQDFLRSIPGSLLCCELHEEWMDVLEEEEDEDEQVQEIKR